MRKAWAPAPWKLLSRDTVASSRLCSSTIRSSPESPESLAALSKASRPSCSSSRSLPVAMSIP
ncbi:hypothetical protein ACFFX0_11765 [Citricoccus parietis]|uniref:Uncharacterized protein n=1 Tax=Citricoccus parietis TaxID=592307 RepID=A0ABV5FYS9_9MICC